SLGNFSGEGQCLQESELRGSQTEWPESRVVVLGQHARGPTETRAHAGKSERRGLTHTMIDAYTCIGIQEDRSRSRVLDSSRRGARSRKAHTFAANANVYATRHSTFPIIPITPPNAGLP